MNKSILNLLVVVSLISLFSCSEEEDPLSKEYLEFVVNGEKYDGTVEEWSYFDTEICDDKKGTRVNVGEIENSHFYIDLRIVHYTNLEDFISVEEGDYNVRNSLGSSDQLCNFEAVVRFKDYTQDDYLTSIKDGGTNTISEIKKLDENSHFILYAVKGNINCTFVNKSEEEISVMLNYKVLLLVYSTDNLD